NLSNIEKVHAPVLFIHAEHDEAIPVEMAERLYQRAKTEKRFHLVTGASHNDTYIVGGRVYFNQWQVFLDECVMRRAGAISA
ncbi:MAG: alpha/beta hydrolase, partial [Nitrospirota bacterium]